MLTTVLVTGAIWACIAVVVGLLVGRRLRHRAPAASVERPEIRKGA
jgi:hypothetical protein